jgi:hypothetical protein
MMISGCFQIKYQEPAGSGNSPGKVMEITARVLGVSERTLSGMVKTQPILDLPNSDHLTALISLA